MDMTELFCQPSKKHDSGYLNRMPNGKWPYNEDVVRGVTDALNGKIPHKYINWCAPNCSLETNWRKSHPGGKCECYPTASSNFFCDWVDSIQTTV